MRAPTIAHCKAKVLSEINRERHKAARYEVRAKSNFSDTQESYWKGVQAGLVSAKVAIQRKR